MNSCLWKYIWCSGSCLFNCQNIHISSFIGLANIYDLSKVICICQSCNKLIESVVVMVVIPIHSISLITRLGCNCNILPRSCILDQFFQVLNHDGVFDPLAVQHLLETVHQLRRCVDISRSPSEGITPEVQSVGGQLDLSQHGRGLLCQGRCSENLVPLITLLSVGLDHQG